MTEMTLVRLEELMVVLYAVSLVFYFIDYLKRDRLAHRYAFVLLAIVYFLQTINLFWAVLATSRIPIYSLFDSVYLIAWILISISLILHASHKYSFFIFFINIIGFIFMTIHTFGPTRIAESTIRETLISELLIIHITFAILAYVAFAIGLIFAVLYLLLYSLLKQKKWSKQFDRYPSLHQTMMGMKITTYVGIPLLFVSLTLGVQWANIMLNDWSILDFKIISSFFLLMVYGVILYLHKIDKLRANDYAWANVFAFLLVIINFFLASRLSHFHYWL
ncbi:cytochrome c biogenesis protein CcsA [Savagea sp. SN6]|uniref:Cytochrome c biogenesis protein CcsA n=1 Tax=Savagea serpentis TaxID=2785297 RepID=A0A8J7KSR6_9BACL|nr:cytochrome c biogenesis protein CcsA [Savagea serpentis]MBF4500844.1 cytochrome c biogenesis protein CcsA [Savagea serpentis]